MLICIRNKGGRAFTANTSKMFASSSNGVADIVSDKEVEEDVAVATAGGSSPPLVEPSSLVPAAAVSAEGFMVAGLEAVDWEQAAATTAAATNKSSAGFFMGWAEQLVRACRSRLMESEK